MSKEKRAVSFTDDGPGITPTFFGANRRRKPAMAKQATYIGEGSRSGIMPRMPKKDLTPPYTKARTRIRAGNGRCIPLVNRGAG